MAIQLFNTSAGRINKLKGEILAHAVPVEVLGITGQQKQMPKNVGDTVVYRRWIPYGSTTAAVSNGVYSQDTWTGVDPNAHLTVEGITPPADTLTPQDISVQLNQYSVLYAVTDKTVDLYEDDVPAEMKKQTGERLGLVRELVRYGALKAATNKFYAGGFSRVTVTSKITLNVLRKVSRSLQANHAQRITRILSASPNFATTPVEASYLVFVHSDAEADIRDLPGFKHVSEYGQRQPVSEYEIGSVENFRFITSPELAPYIGATGVTAAVGATGLYASGGSFIDVYPFIVVAEDAWGQVALRGANSLDVTWLPPGTKDKNDPLGQRGYIGAKTYFNSVVLNQGWMAVVEAGVTSL